MVAVDVEITPQPSQEEREAILAALDTERLVSAGASPWRRAGLGPGPVVEEDEELYAVAPPRQRRGATRA